LLADIAYTLNKRKGILIMTLNDILQQSPFAIGGENVNYAQYFDGKSYLNMLSTQQVVIGNVTFEAGCRNHWHIHHAKSGGGQLLIVTAGRGYGAAPNSAFQHLAIEVAGEETSNEWCEPVAEAEYVKLS